MSKEQNVINYYLLCNKLTNIIRTGWKIWNVQRDRIESIAEHIYNVQMLAIAMKSEYKYKIDIEKVILMLAIHELGETVIGDITQFDITKENKKRIEHDAVHKILEPLLDGKKIESLFLEFDSHETPESLFAFQCDKLQNDIQSKIYDKEGCIDLNNQENNHLLNNEVVKKYLESKESFSNMWIKFGQNTYPYDENFMAVSNYVLNNDIEIK